MSFLTQYGFNKSLKNIVKGQWKFPNADDSTNPVTEVNTLIQYKDKFYASLGANFGKIVEFDGYRWTDKYVEQDYMSDLLWRMTTWGSEIFNDELCFGGVDFVPNRAGILHGTDPSDLSWSYLPTEVEEVFSLRVWGDYLYAGALDKNHTASLIYRTSDLVTFSKVLEGTITSGKGFAPIVSILGRRNPTEPVPKNPELVAIGGFGIGWTGRSARPRMWNTPDGATWSVVNVPDDVESFGRSSGEFIDERRTAPANYVLILGASPGVIYLYDGTNFVRLHKFSEHNHVPELKYYEHIVYFCTGYRGGLGDVWSLDLETFSLQRILRCYLGFPVSLGLYEGNLFVGLYGSRHDNRNNVIIAITPEALTQGDRPPIWSPLWDAESIDANDTSPSQAIGGYTNKTIYFQTDTAGDLTIQISFDAVTWRDYDTVAISANTLTPYKMTGDVGLVRLEFSDAATVSAWMYMQE